MNLPNKITVFRVLMVPVFMWLYLAPPIDGPAGRLAALAVFVIASASDALDGYIARRYALVTDFGKLMDPLADKMLVSAALVALTADGRLPAWVTILIISREFFISGFRQLALERQVVLAASFWAKIKTITQMAMVIFLMLPLDGGVYAVVQGTLVAAASLLTVLSAAEYVLKNKGKLKKHQHRP